ncbi:MAG TPA: hypothetical protein VFV75_02100 [Candidatus Polarisedimenticolaceae bacterium]|nr:hypothetical protein [Candidatus Polarisedimenticolaceae bacterium]
MARNVEIGLNGVIVAVTRRVPRVLVLRATDALPFGPFDPEDDRTLELGLRRWVRRLTGTDVGYVEQLYSFGNRDRDPREREGGPRVVSIAYLALMRELALAEGSGAVWRDVYGYLPWEDWREGRPAILARTVVPRLSGWIEETREREERRRRRERVEVAFGLHGAPWNEERVLDRYELIYETGLAQQSALGAPMAMDHRRILASALGRLRGKLKYRPVVFELLPAAFTLLELQQTVEALAGQELHKQNFRRLVETAGLVERTTRVRRATGGRPAALYRFRPDVLRERPAPGMGLPRGWRSG